MSALGTEGEQQKDMICYRVSITWCFTISIRQNDCPVYFARKIVVREVTLVKSRDTGDEILKNVENYHKHIGAHGFEEIGVVGLRCHHENHIFNTTRREG